MIGKDKIYHFVSVFSIVLIVSLSSSSLELGVLSGVGIGIGKEVYDYKKKGVFSKMDLVADLLGALLGLVVVVLL